MEDQDMSSQGMESQDVEQPEVMDGQNGGDESQGESPQSNVKDDPLYVQKRLKQQKRAHEREIRELHAKINSMQNNGSVNTAGTQQDQSPYQPGSVDDQIHKAVSHVLGLREQEEQRAKQQQSQMHVAKQYQELNKHLDNVSDKYDDFDDVVRGQDTPFTPHMRDAALLLDMDHNNPGSAGEVLYKLGKNPEELSRISKLHPLEQAREMNKLARALIKGGDNEKSAASQPKVMGAIKNSPVRNNTQITDKTPISTLRERMKSRDWK